MKTRIILWGETLNQTFILKTSLMHGPREILSVFKDHQTTF